ncbi:hypothetical protein QBC46DRAFT_408787 [Diplogelasinospora grovesii]|uniref:Uncharacterized protein n=1 Tax=Diplogelasinospora grovesii TaxID=303347 RepID=A0AAN6N8S4_9PEZI|nr:hypothetical protein QBC46DRAFT_408787 [Diplogelasinospora grovesii]
MQIDSRGRPGPVWVIYNFHRQQESDWLYDELSDEPSASERRIHIPVRHQDGQILPHIGRLTPASSKTFTLAKIANSFRDLGEGAQMAFDIHRDREYQIVRVRDYTSPSSDHYLLRQYIKDETT